MSCQGANLSMLFAFWFTVVRHGPCPRDDKVIFVWGGFTELAMVTPALHRDGSRPQRLPCRHPLGFEGNLFLQVNLASSRR